MRKGLWLKKLKIGPIGKGLVDQRGRANGNQSGDRFECPFTEIIFSK